MRLIQCRTLQLREFSVSEIPPYAILSHTWEEGEVTFAGFSQGAQRGVDASVKSWEKISQTCTLAVRNGYEYVWIDTCCIDKSSSAELTEAINSMYSWYAGSGKCFAYLSDFNQSTAGPPNSSCQFFASRWFSRGWTLQELIAPEDLEFYDSSWVFYGSKAGLCADIADATGIDEQVLCAAGMALKGLLASIPVCRKMSWAAGRETRRPEDVAYSLLGIFGVHMPLIYGEGANAFARLQKKIIKSTNDLTILAWKSPHQVLPWDHCGVLAPSPNFFSDSGDIVLSQDLRYNPDFSITNKGLQVSIALPVVSGLRNPIMSLHCHRQDRYQESLGIHLGSIGGNLYGRALANEIPIETEGERLLGTSIFLSIQPHSNNNADLTLHRTNISSLTLLRGHHFQFRFNYHPEMTKCIRILSVYPERRWDEAFGFRAKDTPSFIGMVTYQALWQDRTANFVLACGFGPGYEPWACINREGSDLWAAAMHHNSIRVGELARKVQRDKVTLKIKMFVTVEVKPFRQENCQPNWMRVMLYVGRALGKRTKPAYGPSPRYLDLADEAPRCLPAPKPR
ncbi:putative HET domain-containing protein [Rosellinia necatrix]|uniref:Putative HET domain-containing protein n=1 Tax=Rosellinia necatrix TaxID=77044 RepID=A0A1W2TTE9_ROSNE|nr:putative HET domain-containing protein [Rosellinia necatrix]